MCLKHINDQRVMENISYTNIINTNMYLKEILPFLLRKKKVYIIIINVAN